MSTARSQVAPKGMRVGGRERRVCVWSAVVILHYAFSKKEVVEKGRDKKIISVQTGEYLPRECCLCNGISDCSEDLV